MNESPVIEKKYGDIKLGESASFLSLVDKKIVEAFSKLSGDCNPLHMDESYASHSHFGKRVAHGMIVGALFSKLIGVYLPGKYSLYLSQTLQFHNPVFLGTEIEISGTVTHKSDVYKTVTIATTARDPQSKKIFANGEAVVQLLQ
jgi:3-hydroxybutyryl-CoA dehydratase